MRSFEIEALEAGKAHPAAREEADAASPDLAARAAVAGRTEALGPAAVMRLQRAAGNAGVVAALDGEQEQESPVREVIGRGGGQPLSAPVRQRMEASFGTDFSDVRVHAGGSAATSAQAVDAHAYTVGNEIVLGDGGAPGSPDHERTLAHELTHVVQQRSGPVDGTPASGGIAISDPTDRFERAAEATADAVITTGRAPDAGGLPVGGAAVQRMGGPEEAEEDDVQALAIQRRDEDETEEVPATVAAPAAQSASQAAAPAAQGAGQAPATETAPAAQAAGPATPSGEPAEEEEDVQALAIQRAAAEDDIAGLEPAG